MPARIASRLERRSSTRPSSEIATAIGAQHAKDRQRQLGTAGAEQAGQADVSPRRIVSDTSS